MSTAVLSAAAATLVADADGAARRPHRQPEHRQDHALQRPVRRARQDVEFSRYDDRGAYRAQRSGGKRLGSARPARCLRPRRRHARVADCRRRAGRRARRRARRGDRHRRRLQPAPQSRARRPVAGALAACRRRAQHGGPGRPPRPRARRPRVGRATRGPGGTDGRPERPRPRPAADGSANAVPAAPHRSAGARRLARGAHRMGHRRGGAGDPGRRRSARARRADRTARRRAHAPDLGAGRVRGHHGDALLDPLRAGHGADGPHRGDFRAARHAGRDHASRRSGPRPGGAGDRRRHRRHGGLPAANLSAVLPDHAARGHRLPGARRLRDGPPSGPLRVCPATPSCRCSRRTPARCPAS